MGYKRLANGEVIYVPDMPSSRTPFDSSSVAQSDVYENPQIVQGQPQWSFLSPEQRQADITGAIHYKSQHPGLLTRGLLAAGNYLEQNPLLGKLAFGGLWGAGQWLANKAASTSGDVRMSPQAEGFWAQVGAPAGVDARQNNGYYSRLTPEQQQQYNTGVGVSKFGSGLWDLVLASSMAAGGASTAKGALMNRFKTPLAYQLSLKTPVEQSNNIGPRVGQMATTKTVAKPGTSLVDMSFTPNAPIMKGKRTTHSIYGNPNADVQYDQLQKAFLSSLSGEMLIPEHNRDFVYNPNNLSEQQLNKFAQQDAAKMRISVSDPIVSITPREAFQKKYDLYGGDFNAALANARKNIAATNGVIPLQFQRPGRNGLIEETINVPAPNFSDLALDTPMPLSFGRIGKPDEDGAKYFGANLYNYFFDVSKMPLTETSEVPFNVAYNGLNYPKNIFTQKFFRDLTPDDIRKTFIDTQAHENLHHVWTRILNFGNHFNPIHRATNRADQKGYLTVPTEIGGWMGSFRPLLQPGQYPDIQNLKFDQAPWLKEGIQYLNYNKSLFEPQFMKENVKQIFDRIVQSKRVNNNVFA